MYIDYEADSVKFHAENAIIVPKFTGQEDDRSLIDLIPFLERKLSFYN